MRSKRDYTPQASARSETRAGHSSTMRPAEPSTESKFAPRVSASLDLPGHHGDSTAAIALIRDPVSQSKPAARRYPISIFVRLVGASQGRPKRKAATLAVSTMPQPMGRDFMFSFS